MKKLLAIVLCLIMALSLVACAKPAEPADPADPAEPAAPADPAEPADDAMTIVIIPKLVHEFYNLVLDGANLAKEELAAEGKNIEIIWSAPSTADTVEQAEKFEAAIALNPDYIAVAVIDGEGMKPLMEQAQAEGIKVISFDTTFEGDPSDAYVGTSIDSQYESGKLHADKIVELSGKEEGKVAMLIGSPDAENHILFAGGFRDRLAEAYPGWTIVTEQADNDDKEKATQLAEAILAQYPDIDAIYGGNGSAGVGAAAAVEAAEAAGQIEKDQVIVTNVCFMPEPEEAMKKGFLNVVIDYSPYWIGYYVSMIAAAEYFDELALQDVVMTFGVVTEENMDTYSYDEVGKAAGIEYWAE